MLSPNMAFILGYLCSLSILQTLLVGTDDEIFCQFLKYVRILVATYQTGFPGYGHLFQTLENSIDFKFFTKKHG